MRRMATLRTGGVYKFCDTLEWRFPRAGEFCFVRQHYRQVFFGHGHHPAVVTINNRNWGAPEALARDAPVANSIRHRSSAKTFLRCMIGHFPNRVVRKPATPLAAVDQHAVFHERSE